jgi:hypothetical protein
MYRLRAGPRLEYREQENLQVENAPSLAEQFPQLKSLTVDLSYFDSTG